jgi:predicted lysophospholipase L1 biosynthesis ABC-type transport system permease subunit
MDTDMATISKLQDRQSRIARGVKAAAVVVVLASMVVAGEHIQLGHAASDHATVTTLHGSSANAQATTYFPSQFAAPANPPEAHVEAF